jgi:hypothetical protein
MSSGHDYSLQRPYFSAGPAAMPEEVLRRLPPRCCRLARLSGMGVMEMSHRGKEFISIYEGSRSRPARTAGGARRTSKFCSCKAAAWLKTPSCR